MVRAQTAHFWVGRFLNGKQVADYFAEVWNEEDEDREYTPLSAFARDQGKKWYDHDFLEYGFSDVVKPIKELAVGHSYSDQWAAELDRRTLATGMGECNMFVFIEEDQIPEPRSVEGDDYSLHYLGTITFRI
jgi:hypothetical protein